MNFKNQLFWAVPYSKKEYFPEKWHLFSQNTHSIRQKIKRVKRSIKKLSCFLNKNKTRKQLKRKKKPSVKN